VLRSPLEGSAAGVLFSTMGGIMPDVKVGTVLPPEISTPSMAKNTTNGMRIERRVFETHTW